MNTWFDRRHCVICNHPPTRFANPNIPDSMIATIFEESPSVPSSSPPTENPTTNNSTLPPPSQTAGTEEAITIHFNNKPLTLSLPSLSNVNVNNANSDTSQHTSSIQTPDSLITHHPKLKSGTGPTYKCKQCFARIHLDCIESQRTNKEDIVCPVCIGNASITTQLNYKNLEQSIEEEKNLLRDWSCNECLACGDVGALICCDLCFYDGQIDKVDDAAQFHLKCVMKEANTEFCGVYEAPDPFICPICRHEFGANRLQSLHFYQRRRTKERERRMQLKAEAAQEYIKQIGFEVDEMKRCVFCRSNSDDTASGVFFDKENEFIGPFYVGRIKYWAHYQCVMWAPQVFMNESNTFENVEMEIKRSKGLTCSVCGKHGAVLGCYEKGCYSTYHYPCAKRDAHCYFDNDLFAIYCPSHYFVHFMQNTITENINSHKIEEQRVHGMNKELYEKARFDKSLSGKRKCAKSCRASDVCDRYGAATDVWKCIMNQQHKHSASVTASVSPISPSVDRTRPLTRARRKQIEEKKKKKYKQSLMSFGGNCRKRSLQNYLNEGNLVCLNDEKQQLSPHEVKRRRVFNLQPVLVNDKTLNKEVQIEPDTLNMDDVTDAIEYDMASQVGGCDHAINVLKETVLLPLLYPQLFASFQLKPAKGVILYGPPGTGKTLLVRSLIKYYYAMSKAAMFESKSKSISTASPSPKAVKNPNIRYSSLADAVAVDHENENNAKIHKHESLISFFSRRGPDLLSKFHGETERNLRSLFARAQELAPSIIFFDEMDGMAPIRSHKHEQVNNSVVATLLSLMDGLDSSSANNKVFVIAATNRIDNLDPALRRPGRFDREIFIGLPNQKQRYKILRIHTKKWNVEEGMEQYLKCISQHETIGFSGADLAALCNETFLNCIHRLCPQLKQCVEYKEDIANQLQSHNIRIAICDFKQTFDDGFKCSAMRNGGATNAHAISNNIEHDLSANGKRRLDELMQRMDVHVNRCKNGDIGVPPKAIHCDDDDDAERTDFVRSIKQARLISQYNDRILICSDNCNHWLLSFILHKLDIANVQYVSIPMIAAQRTRQDTYHYILNKIGNAITTGIGVIVLYDLDIWLQFYPKIIETILLSNVKEMCRDRNTFILATSNKKWNAQNCWNHQWPQNVYQYFSDAKHNFFIQ